MDPENIHISGEDLQKLRLFKGIKQRTIAKLMHISQQAYSKLEHAKIVKTEKAKEFLKLLRFSKKEIRILQKIIPTLFLLF